MIKGLGHQADFEPILGYHVDFTCYCRLTVWSQPIRVFIVRLMYYNTNYGIILVDPIAYSPN